MADVYYTCNLLPPGLISRAGHTPRWLGNYLQDPAAPARRDALAIHPMTCPYVTRLVAAADSLLASASEDRLVVPGGCDAMRRLGDLLAAVYPGRVLVLSLPRSGGDQARTALTAELERLERWLAAEGTEAATSGRAEPPTPGAGAPANGAPHQPAVGDGPHLDYLSPPRMGGVFVVAGPLSDDALLRLLEQLGATVSGLESCTSPDRWKLLASAGTPSAAGAAASADDASPGPAELAALMLEAGICPRRSTLERRQHLTARLDETRPSAVIYARQSFCDPGAYDALEVARLAEERHLPYLEIEVGFPFEASGPLRTRVEAFLEAQFLDEDLLDDLDDDLLDPHLDDDLRDDMGEPEFDTPTGEEG